MHTGELLPLQASRDRAAPSDFRSRPKAREGKQPQGNQTPMAKILIIEDEPQMRRGVQDNLEFEGYEVDVADDGKSGLQKILEHSYDLVLLDVMLPQVSGFDVCRKAREKGIATPIIMLTAKGEEIDKVLGLELGADDYITKPFGLRELLARTKAVLRRTEGVAGGPAEKMTLGAVEVDFKSYTAIRA